MQKSKTKILNMFARIKEVTVKSFNLRKTLISCAISFVVFSLIFPAGALSSGTINEECANYFADVSKNYTVHRGDKSLSGLIVEPTDGKDTNMRRDTDRAIDELWGVFKGENASFAPVKNANRENDIRFTDPEYSDECLSFVYTYAGQSSIPYHTIKKNGEEEIVDYKFQCSPIALLFNSPLGGITKEHHIYISQAQAERKLRAKGITDINYETLKTLQYEKTQFTVNGKTFDCVIDNIYLDNFSHSYKHANYDYYYATDIGTVIGDFVFIILTHIDKEIVLPSEVKDQSLYVMSEHSFRNKFYLEYAIESYSPDGYSFKYSISNLKEGFTPNNEALNKTLKGKTGDVWCTIITVSFIVIFLCGCIFIYKYKLYLQPLSLIMLFVVSVAPFLIFKIIFAITLNTYIFSNYSLIFNLVMLIVFVLFVVLLNLFGRKLEEKHAND